ncbi:MAG: phospholipase D-like domain-containing protein [Thermodesulfobacteriota bacterium]
MFKILIKKHLRFLLGLTLLGTCLLVGTEYYNVYKPLPEGLSFAGKLRPVDEIVFYKDITWIDVEGKRHSQQEIFDKVVSMIDGAKNLVVLDMFLFNDFIGKEQTPYRRLAKEITDALVVQKIKYPEMLIVVITDPINTVYNSITNSYFKRMESENIHVVFTKLERLRDSNPAYSAFWRIFVKPFGNSPGSLLPNPFGKGRVSLRSYLAMLNFKANHRKLIICDDADGHSALITSANPHDGSSAHGNVAIYFKGPAVLDLLQSEKAVLDFSGGPTLPINPVPKLNNLEKETTVQILSERKIKDSLITALNQAVAGDKLAIIAFYLSDRDIICALEAAYNRGATVRVLLDPNKDAFGREKNGIPNRQVADELVKLGIPVRWSNTHGEQSHTKMLLAEYKQGQSIVILGSANFTRRNLNDLNLETNIAVYGPTDTALFMDIRKYIYSQWNNTDGKKNSVDYINYADKSLPRRMLYRWMEGTGMSTF